MQTTSHCSPIVSIGMPVFNCARTIAQAITSIVNQTFKDWELLIIDDGSTDNTLAIATSFDDPRIIVMRGGENKRLPTRLNECISKASGAFFARMDGDDIAYPQRLQCQLKYLRSHPAVDLVGGWVVVFRNDGTAFGARRGLPTHEQMWAHSWKGILMPHSTWMGKIEWFRRNHYHTVAAAEDQELLFRTYQNSRFATVSQIVLGYREDGLSLPYLLLQRRHLCKHLVRNAIQQRRFTSAALCIVSEAAKGLVEVVATCTGLNHRMLRRRAMPIHGDEAREWHSVWEDVRLASEEHRSATAAASGASVG
jgi:glycosyltransferase involved in cell wall biosynthesis